jgi:serine phosphatase RsbU (regulator of sigma subunit)/ubiquinone/menaquinone biosynthesis C-methylase UbiE
MRYRDSDSPARGSQYIHGTSPEEQERLSLLNDLLNAASLRAMRLQPGQRVLDLGSGLGQLTRAMARQVQPDGLVVGIERAEDQLKEARRRARQSGSSISVEFRQGEAETLPLTHTEWGSFDVVHARFVLEHLSDPQAVVRAMTRAVRPGGRIILEDDNHELLRLWPPCPEVEALWQAYIDAWKQLGNDPYVGRRLTTLLRRAGAEPRRSDMLFFGGSAGEASFGAYVANFVGILEGARQTIVEETDWTASRIEEALRTFGEWSQLDDAVLWYATCWAEGQRPGAVVEGVSSEMVEAAESAAEVPDLAVSAPRAELAERLESAPYRTMLEFLAESAADLSSTLRLEEVFQKIADRVRLLLDAHLLCILLWNDEEQVLEHSYSLKFGEHIEQHGGFPLGYGLSGCAAQDRMPIRVPDVLEDPRYVRFRHAEVEVRSELAIPLIANGRLIGVLDLESVEYDAFTLEHERTLLALGSHIAAALENARLYETVRREERRLEEDLSAARKIQGGLLPQSAPGHAVLDIGFAHHPAWELSGDFFDVLEYADGRLAVALGDVAGKGTAAALLASLSIGILRSQVLQSRGRPSEILQKMNVQLRELNIEHRFVALLLAVFEPDAMRLRISDSGVPQPLLIRRGQAQVVDVTGVPLGRLEDLTYREELIPIIPGDVVVLVSDGVEDCVAIDRKPFGRERIERVAIETAHGSAQQIADALLAASEDYSLGSDGEMDDRTIVVMKAR